MKNHVYRTRTAIYNKSLLDLGVTNEMWVDLKFPLSKVVAWRHSLQESDDIIPEETLVYLSGESPFTIETPFYLFDKIMEEYLANN
jgi:hypothetical protein